MVGEYQYIKKYFGENWLEEQKSFIESGKWIEGERNRTRETMKIAFFVLEQIDILLKKFESIEGFSQWVRDAKNSKENFKDLLFELLVLENLSEKSDEFKLRTENQDSGAFLEASLKKQGLFSYIECTNLDAIPINIQNKVKDLFNKSTKKFRGKQGIHFIGVFNFFGYSQGVEIPSPELKYLIECIKQKFKRGEGSRVLAFVITNIFVAYNPQLNQSFVQKRFLIIPNPSKFDKKLDSFFDSIFDVDEIRRF